MAKLCVFSEVSGVVLRDGQPVAGAEIERRWSWATGDPTVDTVRSGADGTFRFPAAYARSLVRSLLPVEPVVQQEIVIRHEGTEYVAYDHVKRNYDENGEFNGRAVDLACRLEADPDGHELFYGICTLES